MSGKHRLWLGLVVCLVLATTAVAAAETSLGEQFAGSLLPGDVRSEQRVGPGVVHAREYISSGPLNFNVLKVDLGDPRLQLEVVKGRGTLFTGSKVHDVVRRVSRPGHAVIGAVNGDFWTNEPRMFLPINLCVTDGMIYSLSVAPAPRSVFAITDDGKAYLGPVSTSLEMTAGKKMFKEMRLNDARATEGLVLFTPPFGDEVPVSKFAGYVKLKLESPVFVPNKPAKVVVSGVEKGSTATLSTGSMILAFGKDSAGALKTFRKGAGATLLARVPEVKGAIKTCIGGGPMLVRDGKVSVGYEKEKMGKNFSSDRHPRTAVGISADRKTLWLVTVDGRQPLISIGQNLYDLAEYMIGLGCDEAINLDGGGSTTMVVRGDVTNKPSDRTGPRTVSNALLVVSTAATGPLAQLELEPKGDPVLVPAGAKATFSVRGFDENYNPVEVKASDVTWTADSSLGNGTPAADRFELLASGGAAAGKIVVSAGSGEKRVEADVAAKVVSLDGIDVDPDVFVLSSGETSQMHVTARAEGAAIPLEPDMVTVTASDGSVSASLAGVAGVGEGQGQLTIRVGSTEKKIPYYVDRFRAEMLADFDAALSATLSGTRFDERRSSVAVNDSRAKEGAGCLEFRYAMEHGGTSKVIMPLGVTVGTEPAKFGLWIHGDGKEAWVRAEVVDSGGNRFMLDFTDGSKGVFWKDEWRHVLVPVSSLVPRPSNPGAKVRFPVTIGELYVAQDQEALKAEGVLFLDALEAVYAPSGGMEAGK